MLIKVENKFCIPDRAYPTSAGLDLKAKFGYEVPSRKQIKIQTGLYVKIPNNHVGLVFSRSGYAKHGITLANSVGVVDSEYRGEVILIVINHSNNDFTINQYDRIGQLVVLPILLPDLEIFEGSESEWLDTERGHNGFGSTGVQ
jgi:dUTP pyrophosphatase